MPKSVMREFRFLLSLFQNGPAISLDCSESGSLIPVTRFA